MQKRTGKKVFIHHDGALGDTLLSLPCMDLIRQSASFIHLSGRTDVAAFLKQTGIVDEISSCDSAVYSSLYTDILDESLAASLAAYDALYLFTVHRDSQIAGNMLRISQTVTIINTIPPKDSVEHAAAFRLRQYGYCREGWEINPVRIPAEAMVWAAESLKGHGYTEGQDRIISIHPGSGGKNKCWPWKNFEALIKMIIADPRVFCIVISGPAEDSQTVQALSWLEQNNQRIMHLHQQPLIRIAALLNRSDFYVGNDSGISHLAGVMQCRGVVLFGPTDPRIWRPCGGRLDVLRFESGGISDPLPAGLVYERFLGDMA